VFDEMAADAERKAKQIFRIVGLSVPREQAAEEMQQAAQSGLRRGRPQAAFFMLDKSAPERRYVAGRGKVRTSALSHMVCSGTVPAPSPLGFFDALPLYACCRDVGLPYGDARKGK
jgi:hypothetical protein